MIGEKRKTSKGWGGRDKKGFKMEMERGKKGKLDTMKRKSLKEDQNKKEEESMLLYATI